MTSVLAPSPLDLEKLTDDELLRKVGEMAYAQQMSALEGLDSLEDEAQRAEARALEAEMSRRGLRLE